MKPARPRMIGYRTREVQLAGAEYLIERTLWSVYDPEEDATVLGFGHEFHVLMTVDGVPIWKTLAKPERVKGLLAESRREWK
jgi:hypothetical protein